MFLFSASKGFAAGLMCQSTRGHFMGQPVSVQRSIAETDRPNWISLNGRYDGGSLPEVFVRCDGLGDNLHCRGRHYGANFLIAIGAGWMTEYVTRVNGTEMARFAYRCTGRLSDPQSPGGTQASPISLPAGTA